MCELGETIILVEFVWEGHHREWYEIFYKVLCEKYEVICIVPDVKDWEKTIAKKSLSQPVCIIPFQDPRDSRSLLIKIARKIPACYQKLRFLGVEKKLKELKRSGVIDDDSSLFFAHLPYGGFVGKIPVTIDSLKSVSAMLLDLTSIRYGAVSCLLKSRIISPLALFKKLKKARLLILEEDLLERLRSDLPNHDILHLPEPVVVAEKFKVTDLSNSDQALLEKLTDSVVGKHRLCLSIGMLSKGKGMLDLMESWEISKKRNRWKLFFAGEINWFGFSASEKQRIKDFFKSHPEHVLHDHRIDDDSLYQYCFKKCDLVYAAYRNFSRSSNTLSHAAYAHTPVVVSDCGVMKFRVERYAIGCCRQDDEIEGLEALYKRALNISPRWEEYIEANSLENFREIVLHEMK